MKTNSVTHRAAISAAARGKATATSYLGRAELPVPAKEATDAALEDVRYRFARRPKPKLPANPTCAHCGEVLGPREYVIYSMDLQTLYHPSYECFGSGVKAAYRSARTIEELRTSS
jgi:hypothetical protein